MHFAKTEIRYAREEEMKSGLLNDSAVRSQTKIGDAREWKEIDHLVKQIRFKLADRKSITTVKAYKSAVNKLAQTSHYTVLELRDAVRRQLKGQYLPRELTRDVTPALQDALSDDA
ncbi:MAG: hypothetical protein JWN26_788 [Candidatus Saccharibacteria bacterium]|nr:hypothetical protein [Candidatus Saccharibacteria bacterium]